MGTFSKFAGFFGNLQIADYTRQRARAASGKFKCRPPPTPRVRSLNNGVMDKRHSCSPAREGICARLAPCGCAAVIVHIPYDCFHSPLKCFRASRSGCPSVFSARRTVSRLAEPSSELRSGGCVANPFLSLSLSFSRGYIPTRPSSYGF